MLAQEVRQEFFDEVAIEELSKGQKEVIRGSSTVELAQCFTLQIKILKKKRC